MKSIDLNCDLGESFGNYKKGNDEAVMPYITSCNIACGFHAGDAMTIEKTILLAIKHKVSIGAHPSYPDLQGFGRRYMEIPANELTAIIKYQIAALKGMVEAHKKKLTHVKAHGALYNASFDNSEVAWAIVKAIAAIDQKLIVIGPAMSSMSKIASDMGLRYIPEIFSDRNYRDDLQLVSRAREDAMITDPKKAVQHVLGMVLNNKVRTISGEVREIEGGTVCIHGDQPNAPMFAKSLNDALQKEDILIKSFANG